MNSYRGSRFDIVVINNQSPSTAYTGLRERVFGLRFTTIHPGGCGECSFKMYVDPNAPVVVPPYFGPNYQVRVLEGGDCFWIGRMEAFKFHHGTNGRYWEVIARGYGMNLGDKQNTTTNVQNTQTSTIVSNAITNLAPQIQATSITATGFTINNAVAVNLNQYTAAMQTLWAARFGDSSNTQQVYYVYPDADATIRFTFKPRPSTASVEGYLQDFESASFGMDMRDRGNQAQVQYGGGANFATSSDTLGLQNAGPGGWNVLKQLQYVLTEDNNATDAAQMATTMYTLYSTLRMAATSLSVKKDAVFFDQNGAVVEPWRIQAGTLFRFRDVDPGIIPATSLGFMNSFLISGTSWDEDTQTLGLTPENWSQYLEKSIATVMSMLTGRTRLAVTA